MPASTYITSITWPRPPGADSASFTLNFTAPATAVDALDAGDLVLTLAMRARIPPGGDKLFTVRLSPAAPGTDYSVNVTFEDDAADPTNGWMGSMDLSSVTTAMTCQGSSDFASTWANSITFTDNLFSAVGSATGIGNLNFGTGSSWMDTSQVDIYCDNALVTTTGGTYPLISFSTNYTSHFSLFWTDFILSAET